MDRPGCHTQPRRVVSVYLASLADAAPFPECPGVGTRALRSALRMMCRIAQNDGSMRYGLREGQPARHRVFTAGAGKDAGCHLSSSNRRRISLVT